MATGAVKEEIERKGRQEEDDQPHAEVSGGRRHRVTHEVAETHPSAGPRHRAREAVEGKSDEAHLCRARQGGRDCVQLGQEPSAQLKCCHMGEKHTPSAVDQGAGGR
jgi:hypothetical protein